jgi:hypothetical protein
LTSCKAQNVLQQQEKNNEIVKQNQAEQGEVLQENIPAEDLEEGEESKMSDFLKRTIFKLEGVRNFSNIDLKKIMLGLFTRDDPDAYKSMKMSNQVLNKLFEEEVLRVLREDEDRIDIQAQIVDIYRSSKFIPDEVRMKQQNVKILTDMEGLMMGSGIQFPVKQDDYISIGKYKAHKTKLMGRKLQMRSNNNNQIHNLKVKTLQKISVIFY